MVPPDHILTPHIRWVNRLPELTSLCRIRCRVRPSCQDLWLAVTSPVGGALPRRVRLFAEEASDHVHCRMVLRELDLADRREAERFVDMLRDVKVDRPASPRRDRATVRTRETGALLGMEQYGLGYRDLVARLGRNAAKVSR